MKKEGLREIMQEKKILSGTRKSIVAIAAIATLFLGQQVVTASTITDASGHALPGTTTNGSTTYNIAPDAFKDGVGYRKFQDMNLSQGDVMNFIFKYLQSGAGAGENGVNTYDNFHDINKFVNFVKNQININGVVNALQSVGGNLKSDGQLVFISPNGMVVGASGVLNVGSLSVVTPTQQEFSVIYDSDALPYTHTYVEDPTSPYYGQYTYSKNIVPYANSAQQYSDSNDEGATHINYVQSGAIATVTTYSNVYPQAKELSSPLVTFGENGQILKAGGSAFTTNNDAKVQIANGGGIAARGNVNIQAGQVVNNGGIVAGLTTNTVTKDGYTANFSGAWTSDAGALFNALVNTDGITNATQFAGDNGNVIIASTNGIKTGSGSTIYNFNNNSGKIEMTNTDGTGIEIAGKVHNQNGQLTIDNSSNMLNVTNSGDLYNMGTTILTNSGASGMKLNGTVYNNGDLTATNNGASGMSIGGNVTNDTGKMNIENTLGSLNVKIGGSVVSNGSALTMTNSGVQGFNVSGTVENTKGTAKLDNNNGNLLVDNGGIIKNTGTLLQIRDLGNGSLNIKNGKVHNSNGTLTMSNEGSGDFLVGANGQIIGDVDSTSMTLTNSATQESQMTIAQGGKVTNNGTLSITNNGANGLNIDGSVTNTGVTTIKNYGTNGLNVGSAGRVNNNGSSLYMYNDGAQGMNIKGLVTTTNGGTVKLKGKDSNIVIGDTTSNNNYITSNGNVDIEVDNGNLFNYGVAKTLIVTNNADNNNNNLTINVTNGAIGEEINPCQDGVCTGIGLDSRDLTKSINTNVEGRINATSTGLIGSMPNGKANYNGYSVINMASLDQDMHVDSIKADGRVILLADNADLNKKGVGEYSVKNYSTDSTVPNVEGAGISIIAAGNIGENGKTLTFRQTGADVSIAYDEGGNDPAHNHIVRLNNKSRYGVDMLANSGDINVKGLDADDGSKLDTNVCAIVARNGSINAEFSGDTYIRDIHAPKAINVVNRGKDLYIDNLGGIPTGGDPTHVTETLIPVRDANGRVSWVRGRTTTGDYMKRGDYYGEYGDGISPEKVTLKALNLNPEQYKGKDYADSTIVVKNGTIKGKGSLSHPDMDQDVTVTADNAYIDGYYFNMGPHRMPGLSQVTPDRNTAPLVSANGGEEPSVRGRAVRPKDVTVIGRNEDERNYYYGKPTDKDLANGHKPGSGSGQSDDPTFDVDREDGDDLVAKWDPDVRPTQPTTPTDPTQPTVTTDVTDPTDDPGNRPEPTRVTIDDAVMNLRQRVVSDQIDAIDKRQAMRFDVAGNQNNVSFQSSNGVRGILDISRSGVSLSCEDTVKVGDVVPIKLTYGDIDINANVKIVSKTNNRAGGQFINLDEVTSKKILYLSMLNGSNDFMSNYSSNTNIKVSPQTINDGLLNVSYAGK